MGAIKERFLKYVRYKGITQREFLLRCGLAPGYMDRLKRHIGEKKAETIRSEYQDLNLEWLETGHGEMLVLNNETSEKITSHSDNKTVDYEKRILELHVENTLLKERLVEQKELNARLLEIIDNFKKS